MNRSFWGWLILLVAACASTDTEHGDESHFAECESDRDCTEEAGAGTICVRGRCVPDSGCDGGACEEASTRDSSAGAAGGGAGGSGSGAAGANSTAGGAGSAGLEDAPSPPMPPRFEAVDAGNCIRRDETSCCCSAGTFTEMICTAGGLWRCDDGWPMLPDYCGDTDVCTAEYVAPWSTVGAEAPRCAQMPDTADPLEPPWPVRASFRITVPGPIAGQTEDFGGYDLTFSGTWVGATPEPEDCTGECLRLSMELEGEALEVLTTLSEEDVQSLSTGEPIQFRYSNALLSVSSDADEALVFAIAQGPESEDAPRERTWNLDPLVLSTAEAFCAMERLDCNWRSVVDRLRVQTVDGPRTMDPGESLDVTAGAFAYRIDYDFVAHATSAYESAVCSAGVPHLASFHIVRR